MIEKTVTRIGSLPCLHFFLLFAVRREYVGHVQEIDGNCESKQPTAHVLAVQEFTGMALAAALEAAGRLQPLEVNI